MTPTPDEPVRRLLERIAAPASRDEPDLAAIGAALVDLAMDGDWLAPWADRLGERSGMQRIHAPERGPRLTLVHRLEGQLSPIHSHGVWVALAAARGLETHRRYRVRARVEEVPELGEVRGLGVGDVATLLPPNDVHDHGHLVGEGSPAWVLILAGDDQTRYERHEWDAETGRHRLLRPGEPGRWVTSAPWP